VPASLLQVSGGQGRSRGYEDRAPRGMHEARCDSCGGVARVLAETKRRGLVTTLDTVMNPRSRWWDGLADSLPHLDWVLPSYEEAVHLTGETDEALIAAKQDCRVLPDELFSEQAAKQFCFG